MTAPATLETSDLPTTSSQVDGSLIDSGIDYGRDTSPATSPASDATATPPASPSAAQLSDSQDAQVTRDTSRARDERGRFAPITPKAGDPAGAAAPVAGAPVAAPAADAPADPAAEAALEGAPAGAEGAVAAAGDEELPEGQPFAFRAEGEEYTIEGAQVFPGIGLVVPEGQIDTLHRMLGRVIKADSVLSQRDQLLGAARQEIAAQKEFNTQVAGQWERLAELVRAGHAEQAFAELVEFAQALPTLKAEAKAAVLERRIQEQSRALEPDPVQVRREAFDDADARLGDVLQTFTAQPWAKGLTPQDIATVAQTVQSRLHHLVHQAPRDMPEHNIRRGQWVLDEGEAEALIEQQLRLVARYRTETAEAVERERKAQAVAAQQARRTQETITAPPAVSGTPGTAAPRAKTPPRVFKNADEYQAWLEER